MTVEGWDYRVILVEDDPGDARLVMTAIAEHRYRCRVDHLRDGMAAIEHLRGLAGSGDAAELPHLMLLDLNMPRKGGHEVLAEMRADARLPKVPVVVLTTSDAEPDVQSAYRAGAAGYVTKPIDVDALFAAVHGIEDYWFGLVRNPRALRR